MNRPGGPRRLASVPAQVRVRVPAKVNLHLAVGPRRPDGYHEVRTVYQAVGLYDEVTLTPADRLTVTVSGAVIGEHLVPLGDDNLAARAVRAVAALAGCKPAVAIHIDKEIPIAAGMAGGSADAAAALLAADQLFKAGLDQATMLRLAGGLGSDVPFLVLGGTALGTGRGDLISPVLTRGEYHWVVAVASVGLETRRVYAELDRIRDSAATADPDASVDGVLAALRAGDVVALGRALHNDLQPAALRLRPDLRAVLDAGREAGAVGGVVSGSGPTVALLARDAGEATSIASYLSATGLCAALRHAVAPVPGARVCPTS